jgi:type III secretion protein R
MSSETLAQVAVLAALALLPLLALALSAYLKISIVLSALRSALGAAEILPGAIVAAVALVLSIYIMTPVGAAVLQRVQPVLQRSSRAPGLPVIAEAAAAGREPVRAFLRKHAGEGERKLFAELARKLRPDAPPAEVGEDTLTVLAPAFVTSELTQAFEIAFLLFVPFLVIDLVIASVLCALGLTALAPQTVAVPLKLLLFVLVGGWQLIARGLVAGYL